jgi:predicted acetyltransferase
VQIHVGAPVSIESFSPLENPLPASAGNLPLRTDMNTKSANDAAVRLVSSAETPPKNLEALLRELGAGDSFFQGTSFGRGECDFKGFLRECNDCENGRGLPADKVPQSTYWLVDQTGSAVGIVRVRHRLNERLMQYGGHIGYYVAPAERGKGYGKLILQLALENARQLGIGRALLTVNPQNKRSRRVILTNGGIPDGLGTDPVTGEIVERFWIDLQETSKLHR